MEGCGGVWLRKKGQKQQENGRKMGGKWDKIPIFHSPPFPIFPEVKDLPHSPLCENRLTALTDGKMGSFATHRHSPPRRLVRMLGCGSMSLLGTKLQQYASHRAEHCPREQWDRHPTVTHNTAAPAPSTRVPTVVLMVLPQTVHLQNWLL